MSIGLLITTCRHYFSNIKNIIQDIEDCKFPKKNILIVSGQEDENSIYYENDIKIVKVTYTGLHLTGVIYLNENMGDLFNVNYWIILPDTIRLNRSFYKNIMKYYDEYLKYNKIYSLPFINPAIRPTMDMGIIHINHIYNMSDYLNKIKKSIPYTIDDILQLKKQLIYDENIILGLSAPISESSTCFKHVYSYPTPNIFIINEESELIERPIIINDKLCNEVYFFNISIYKYQRNFNGPDVPLIMEL